MGKKTLSGGQLAGGNSTSEREKNDFYATDPETVKIFLNAFLKENILKGNVLEPACGDGNISKTLEETGLDINITSTDLIDRGYGQGNIDFITHDYGKKFDTVITNPPFSLAKEFIEKGLEVSEKYVIMLCKIQLLEGVKRKDMFLNTPLKYVYVHTTRQATWKEGKPLDPKGRKWATTMCLAWFVWDKEYKGEPIIRWI
jgi:hypothetical protein